MSKRSYVITRHSPQTQSVDTLRNAMHGDTSACCVQRPTHA